jgi:hypothetical protein
MFLGEIIPLYPFWHLRGEEKARGFFSRISKNKEYEMWTGVLQRGEIVFFMRDEEEEGNPVFFDSI